MSVLVPRGPRDPFAEFDALVRAAFGPVRSRTQHVPFAEVARDGQDAVIRLEVPGLDPERDVTVEVDRGHLVVRGERRDERKEENGGRSLREFRYGSFRRVFALPEHVTGKQISASYDAGIVSVRVTGAYDDATTPTRIPVTSGAAEEAPAPAAEAGKQDEGEAA